MTTKSVVYVPNICPARINEGDVSPVRRGAKFLGKILRQDLAVAFIRLWVDVVEAYLGESTTPLM